MVVFKQLVRKVGLENLPLLQPKHVECSGVQELVSAFQGTQICLAPVMDQDSDISDMSVAHDSSIPAGFLSSDALALESEAPVNLEDGEIIDDPHAPEEMDQSEEQGHVAQPGGAHSAT